MVDAACALHSWDWPWLLLGGAIFPSCLVDVGGVCRRFCRKPAAVVSWGWGAWNAEAVHRQVSRDSREHLKSMLPFLSSRLFKYKIEMKSRWIVLLFCKTYCRTILEMY